MKKLVGFVVLVGLIFASLFVSGQITVKDPEEASSKKSSLDSLFKHDKEEEIQAPPTDESIPPENQREYPLASLTGNQEYIYVVNNNYGGSAEGDADLNKALTFASEAYMDVSDSLTFNTAGRDGTKDPQVLKDILGDRAEQAVYGDANYYIKYRNYLAAPLIPAVPADGKVVIEGKPYTYMNTFIKNSFDIPEVEMKSKEVVSMRGYCQRAIMVIDEDRNEKPAIVNCSYGLTLTKHTQDGWKINTIGYQENEINLQ